jgi:hypothetical protein
MNPKAYKFVSKQKKQKQVKEGSRFPKINSQKHTTHADFVVYHLKFKTRVKQNLFCSKHDGAKPKAVIC